MIARLPVVVMAIVFTLFFAVMFLPAGPDRAIPAVAAGLPLLWAALASFAAGGSDGLGPKGRAVAMAAALPFSAYAASAYGFHGAALLETATAAVAAAAAILASALPGREGWPAALAFACMAVPLAAVHALAGAPYALVAGVFGSACAALALYRRHRP